MRNSGGTQALSPKGRSFLTKWLVATTLGWLLGFVFVIVLAVVWDTLGGGAQFMVGVGMGAGVGWTQSRILRPWLPPLPWLLVSTLGMGVPFLVQDIANGAGGDWPNLLVLYVGPGACLVAILQGFQLRRRFGSMGYWLPACIVGWLLPVGLMALHDLDLIGGLGGGVLHLTGMFLGGLLLGAVTAKPLRHVLESA